MTRAALAAWRAHLAIDQRTVSIAVRILNDTQSPPAVERATDTQQAGAHAASPQPAPAAADEQVA
jgi:hypothetical protein